MDLKAFDVDPIRGFLPTTDPLVRLPQAFDAWENLAQQLPKFLVSDSIRAFVKPLPPFETSKLRSEPEFRRAMVILSYLGHSYAWGEAQPVDEFPKVLAHPWYEVSTKLGRPPVLSYASYALDNWRRLDPSRDIALDNIALLQNFLGGIDEEWFILIHVDIEAKAGKAMVGVVNANKAIKDGDTDKLTQALADVEASLADMYAALDRMPDHCDPYIYYNRVRPYIHGWKNHPLVPQGIRYQGVAAYANQPQQFRGETGAQSAIIPCLDAALGINHANDPLRPYLLEMRNYMPAKHRAFLEALEADAPIRAAVTAKAKTNAALRDTYNQCIEWVERFRSKHLEYAANYIHLQSQTSTANPTDVGTGGTPFIPYLRKHRDETAQHLV